jgi:hypothetical protein
VIEKWLYQCYRDFDGPNNKLSVLTTNFLETVINAPDTHKSIINIATRLKESIKPLRVRFFLNGI